MPAFERLCCKFLADVKIIHRMTPPPIGKLPVSAIGPHPEPISPDIVAAYLALTDLTGNVSDAMDLLNLSGAVGAFILRPSIATARIAGSALTVKNQARSEPVAQAVADNDNRLADIEAHNIALPGDVLVVQGAEHASSLGGLSATIAKRQGEIGIIVDGLVRDIEASRSIGLPVWAKGTTPATGKWRIETVAVNVPVTIAGVRVTPGDLVVADQTGVCFVARAHIQHVLETAQKIAADEHRRTRLILEGAPLKDVTQKPR
jgi:4-hydroxy-4-methyl-2-oxoglutarate aldolase